MKKYDVIVIGGGQSGLAVGYYLRRIELSFIILDQEAQGGGSWQHMWRSLRLFSPAQWSSLPGVIMKGGADYYPTRDETITYIKEYEQKYSLPIRRSVTVTSVQKDGESFRIETSEGVYFADAVVTATGSFNNPFIPDFPGSKEFKGAILHSSQYETPAIFTGKRVAIVGEGNSGAQVLAEVSQVADTIWITQKEPRYLPDHIDGRYLFDAASQMYAAKQQGKAYQPPSLGDIVIVPPVKDARQRDGVLNSYRPFQRFTTNGLIWEDGREENIDAIIFCTGFKASLSHLSQLDVINREGRADTNETRSRKVNGLWFVGYGNWTGFASATLIGVGRSAKSTVEEISRYVSERKSIAQEYNHPVI